MVYDIEFIRRVDGKAEMMAQDIVRLVGEQLSEVIIKANELFRQIALAPVPDGYRVRESDVFCVCRFGLGGRLTSHFRIRPTDRAVCFQYPKDQPRSVCGLAKNLAIAVA